LPIRNGDPKCSDCCEFGPWWSSWLLSPWSPPMPLSQPVPAATRVTLVKTANIAPIARSKVGSAAFASDVAAPVIVILTAIAKPERVRAYSSAESLLRRQDGARVSAAVAASSSLISSGNRSRNRTSESRAFASAATGALLTGAGPLMTRNSSVGSWPLGRACGAKCVSRSVGPGCSSRLMLRCQSVRPTRSG
jgi:hypothetical protein